MTGIAKRAATIFLALAVIFTFTPFIGDVTGGFFGVQEVYAAESISGEVYASELVTPGEISLKDYTLTGDTTIYIDDSVIIGSIDIKGYTLTIEGNGDDILSVWGKGIEGYWGNVILNSGNLDLDTSGGDGNWTAAIKLTLGEFTINGGSLFMNYSGKGTYSSTAIEVASFNMSGGTATITCTTDTRGSAVGIQTNDFTMTAGDLNVEAKTTVSGQSAEGIVANGYTSDSDFYMSGGTIGAKGTADDQGYGINWTGDKTKNTFVIEGGKVTAEGEHHGISSWVPVTIKGGADVTAKSTSSGALYVDGAPISIRGAGTKVTASSVEADAMDANESTIDLASGVKIIQPEGGYVATYGGNSQSIKTDDGWAKQVVIEGVSREEITQIIATSNITTPVYGEPIPDPEITVETGSPAYFRDVDWLKKTGDDWEIVTGGTFTEGIYTCSAMIRIDEGGTEYILGWPITVTVDGVEWTTSWDEPEVYDTYSRLGIGSPEYVVTGKPVTGWVKKDGYWYYYDADGNMVKNAWKKDSKGWCYLGSDGRMVTGDWAKDSKGWCWIGPDGYMVEQTKWIKVGSDWYHITKGYRDQSKWMKDSKGWCYLGSDGRMVTNGWAKDSVGWCWMGADGYWVSNKWIKDNGEWYYIKPNHYMAANEWAKDSGGWMWMNASGKITKSKWIKDGGYWYYLKDNGYMATGTITIDGKTYTFDSSGRWIK